MDRTKLEECNLKVYGKEKDLMGNPVKVDLTKEKMEEFFAVSNLETLKNKFFNKTLLI